MLIIHFHLVARLGMIKHIHIRGIKSHAYSCIQLQVSAIKLPSSERFKLKGIPKTNIQRDMSTKWLYIPLYLDIPEDGDTRQNM